MKNFITLISIALCLTIFVSGCGKQNNSVAETQQTQQTTETQNNIEIAPQTAINTLAEILNEGYSIADKSKVYIYSFDKEDAAGKRFIKSYFIGTVVKKKSDDTARYACIWVTTDKQYLSEIYSMNFWAEHTTGIMQGSQIRIKYSVTDDGYSQINSKVLGDMKS